MKKSLFVIWCFCSFQIMTEIAYAQSKKARNLQRTVAESLENIQYPFSLSVGPAKIELDTFTLDIGKKILIFRFNTALSYLPAREETYLQTLELLRSCLDQKFKKYDIQIITDGQTWESLIPNFYRAGLSIDPERNERSIGNRIPLVVNTNRKAPMYGLYGRNIALWHSHGWYYEASLDRWEWQRARLYSTVEDMFPMTFVLPYLTPMLENAGANVFLPRERDTQPLEIIVDNDLSSPGSGMNLNGIKVNKISGKGFLKKDTLTSLQNPFAMGSSLVFSSNQTEEKFIEYIPSFDEKGDYAVYISFVHSEENISDAEYTVYHTGGKTAFSVNQKMGGGTWIYLGTFRFDRGKNPLTGSVRLSSKSKEKGSISADAVRFGGGIGNIARRPKTDSDSVNYHLKMSGRARHLEAARYYLQYSGAPARLVYSLNDESNDYNDDYQSRGEWVNYLMSAPNGPNADRNVSGLNIPVDLSLAFHTDAGVTQKDSTVGTLAIYSSVRDEGKFPSGRSKLANRDLSDIIQSEIVNDIRLQFDPEWTRRGLWNKQYSEAWRPNVPTILLELMSHQNLSDMRLGLDPEFKFAVSRAVYKGIVKFLAFYGQSEYVIQPLPPDHFSIIKTGPKSVKLSWLPTADPLEKTALANRYKVYTRKNDGGFDNGQIVKDTAFELELEEYGQIYSFKITALNEGGESFPSEILSAGFSEDHPDPILIVNAFDRISPPAVIDEGDFAGLAFWEDEGVPDHYNIGYTGEQYDFDRRSPWLDDDSPGWGASYGNMEGKLIPGNSFDNVITHGASVLRAGYSFVSASDESFTKPGFDLSPYRITDIIYGEEKTKQTMNGPKFEVFDSLMIKKLSDFAERGGNIFASGAYIGTDIILNKDTLAQKFAARILHFRHRTNHAAKTGAVYGTEYVDGLLSGAWNFNTHYSQKVYTVEAPDALEPSGKGAFTALRYAENNASAGILFDDTYKTFILGFPFETIIDQKERDDLMKQMLDFFDEK